MEISIYDMMFEVTRKCNMKCKHCLRGGAQRLNISEEIISKALAEVKNITTVTITGGEPSLNTEGMKLVFDTIKNSNIDFGYFYVVTNAKRYSKSMVDILDKVFRECDEPEYAALSISMNDGFHDKVSAANIYRYKDLPYYRNDKDFSGRHMSVLNEGRAIKSGVGERTRKFDTKISDYCKENNKLALYDSTVYINAKGDVLLDCDISFKNQKYYKIGNVLESNLSDILVSALEKEVE